MPTKAEIRAMKQDKLKEQCDSCKLYKKDNKHGGCEIRYKLISQNNDVAWKNEHLFLNNGSCKQFKEKR